MMEHVNCIFQFYEHNKSADLILFNISDEVFETSYRWTHNHHVKEETLLYERFDGFDGDFAIFNIHSNYYVFMKILIKECSIFSVHDSTDERIKSVNLLNLAYNMIWNKNENWRQINESEVTENDK